MVGSDDRYPVGPRFQGQTVKLRGEVSCDVFFCGMDHGSVLIIYIVCKSLAVKLVDRQKKFSSLLTKWICNIITKHQSIIVTLKVTLLAFFEKIFTSTTLKTGISSLQEARLS